MEKGPKNWTYTFFVVLQISMLYLGADKYLRLHFFHLPKIYCLNETCHYEILTCHPSVLYWLLGSLSNGMIRKTY